MKKIFAILLIFALVTGCKKEEVIDYTPYFTGTYTFSTAEIVGSERRVYDNNLVITKIADNKLSLSLSVLKKHLNSSLVIYNTTNETYTLVNIETTSKDSFAINQSSPVLATGNAILKTNTGVGNLELKLVIGNTLINGVFLKKQ